MMVEDSRRGYRRVVPSPKPMELIEKNAVKQLVEHDYIVITVSEVGISIMREEIVLNGVKL